MSLVNEQLLEGLKIRKEINEALEQHIISSFQVKGPFIEAIAAVFKSYTTAGYNIKVKFSFNGQSITTKTEIPEGDMRLISKVERHQLIEEAAHNILEQALKTELKKMISFTIAKELIEQ